MVIRNASSVPMGLAHTDQNHGDNDDLHHSRSSDGGSNSNSRMESLRRSLSSTFTFTAPQSPTFSSRKSFLKKSSLRKSLRRLDSSHRLSITCSGSDLSQLYLSSPEQDAIQILSPSCNDINNGGGGNNHRLRRQSSWLQNADIYGQRKGFRRMNSYARFLDMDMMSEIAESDGDDEERMILIEETDGTSADDRVPKVTSIQHKCLRRLKSAAILVPIMMIVDLILGVALSLYDSNLLRNVPGFHFPLCYAFIQKLTNALASLVLIYISRRWEMEEKSKHNAKMVSAAGNDDHLMELPSIQTFRQHVIPLSAVALVQTISAAFANQALQIIPLPLFKVCLMCGPIFVAFMTSVVEGGLYSKGRLFALSLIGVGACRAVYAEALGADNPRYTMEGAAYALGASAFSGVGLVLSSALMMQSGNDLEEEKEEIHLLEQRDGKSDKKSAEVELNPLSLLFYLSCEQVLMLSVYLFPWNILEQQNEAEIEEPGEFSAFTIYFANDPWTAIYYLMMGSMMSLFLAVLTFVLVNKTSPVATSLLGNVRSIATVAISSVFFGNVSGAAGLFGSAAFGYSLTLAGGVGYAFVALGSDNSPSK